MKIAENTELQILKQEVLEELFEEKYEEENKDFLKIVGMYTSYKGDESLKDMIIKIFEFIRKYTFSRKMVRGKSRGVQHRRKKF
ncbi:MAG: hypothetical protein HFJ50_07120 [Clostridia bacterium]|nr:hypothetical protein [Clostridia bacterium]